MTVSAALIALANTLILLLVIVQERGRRRLDRHREAMRRSRRA